LIGILPPHLHIRDPVRLTHELDKISITTTAIGLFQPPVTLHQLHEREKAATANSLVQTVQM